MPVVGSSDWKVTADGNEDSAGGSLTPVGYPSPSIV